jgi:hypothetical protein
MKPLVITVLVAEPVVTPRQPALVGNVLCVHVIASVDDAAMDEF